MESIIPKKLYKYQSYNDHSLENLKNQQLWFSKPFRFNDPFDCKINFDLTKTTDENWKILFDQYKDLSKEDNTEEAEAFADLYFTNNQPNDEFKSNAAITLKQIFGLSLDSEFQPRGVACFSESQNNILMWSHYANAHSGFCLEFDTSLDPFQLARPVNYSTAWPSLNLSDGRTEIMWDLVTTKHIGWSYEKEWRLFYIEGDKKVRFNPSSLTGIYLGCAMSNESKETIRSILQDFSVRIYESKISNSEFRLEFQIN